MTLTRGLQVSQSVLDGRLLYEEAGFEVWVKRFLRGDKKWLCKAQDVLCSMTWLHDLLRTSAMVRLHGLQQWGMKGIGYPLVGKTTSFTGFVMNEIGVASHDRFTHSIQVAAVALCLGVRLEVRPRSLKTLVIAALLHDIGHSPYSHDGDQLLRKYGVPQHEERGQKRVFGDPELLQIMNRAGVRPEAVVSVMREEGALGHLLSLADTAAYVGMDLRMCGVDYAPSETRQVISSVTGVRRNGVVVTTREPIRRLLDDRAQLGREVYFTRRVCAIAEATCLLWKEVFRQNLVTPDEFLCLMDKEADERMRTCWPKLCYQDSRLIPVRELSLGIEDPSVWVLFRSGPKGVDMATRGEIRQREGPITLSLRAIPIASKSIVAATDSEGFRPIHGLDPGECAPFSQKSFMTTRP